MTRQEAEELILKYTEGNCTPEEKQVVETYFLKYLESNEQLPQQILIERANQEMLSVIEDHIHRVHSIIPLKRLWPRIAAAASILLFLSIGSYIYFNRHKPTNQIASNQPVDIKPGTNKAILTLSNGKPISLTDAKNGQVAVQGNAVVKKTAPGVIAYASAKNNATEKAVEPLYNTLTTPRGGRFEGFLPDGTHVILDAASSIKYQVNITGKDRLVWTTGQVHFNVAYNSNRPFYVNVKGQVMKDLGTSFNVNAYDDEPVIRVTLEEGSVNVSKGSQSVVLIPGEQAITKISDDLIKVQPVNVGDVVAWTRGQTSFQNENIQEIMRQVSRWYNVDVQFEGNVSKRLFNGGISRNANLSDLIKILEFNNVHCIVNGNTVIVK